MAYHALGGASRDPKPFGVFSEETYGRQIAIPSATKRADSRGPVGLTTSAYTCSKKRSAKAPKPRRPVVGSLRVYWATRDLSSFFLGNHHFILLRFFREPFLSARDFKGTQMPVIADECQFLTLAGHRPDDKHLLFRANEPDDVRSVNEVFRRSVGTKWYESDFDLERHPIRRPPIYSSDLEFATKLIELAENYRKNTEDIGKYDEVVYKLTDLGGTARNCVTWINRLLQVTGIPSAERQRLSDAVGIDCGENDENLPLDLFSSTIKGVDVWPGQLKKSKGLA